MQRIAALPVSAYQYTKFQLPSSISFRDMEGGPKIKSYWSLQTPPSEQIYIWSPSTCKCLPACIRNLNYLVRLISEIRRGSQNKSGAAAADLPIHHSKAQHTICSFSVTVTVSTQMSIASFYACLSQFSLQFVDQFLCGTLPQLFLCGSLSGCPSSPASLVRPSVLRGGELVSSLVILIINQLLKTKQTFTYS